MGIAWCLCSFEEDEVCTHLKFEGHPSIPRLGTSSEGAPIASLGNTFQSLTTL